MGVQLRWPAEDLWEQLAPQWPGFSVEVVGEIDSTNAELMRRARQPEVWPTLLVAEHQTAGRGRLGRQWHSQPGECLMMSLGLTLRPQRWAALSLVVGVTVAEALDPEGALGLRLKWPNDVWVFADPAPRKLAGILIETTQMSAHEGRVVVGLGINVQTPPPGPDPFRTPPIGLQALGDARSAPAVLAAVVPPLMQALRDFETQGWAAWHSRYDARDALKGRRVRLSDGLSGTVQGVDAEGGLLVQTPQGVRTVSSDEVSLSLDNETKGE